MWTYYIKTLYHGFKNKIYKAIITGTEEQEQGGQDSNSPETRPGLKFINYYSSQIKKK